MFRVGDFVLCKYYTGIQYIGKIVGFKDNFTVHLEICCESYSKRTFETELIDVEISMLSHIDCSLIK